MKREETRVVLKEAKPLITSRRNDALGVPRIDQEDQQKHRILKENPKHKTKGKDMNSQRRRRSNVIAN